jgi:hypothetical protein
LQAINVTELINKPANNAMLILLMMFGLSAVT